MTIESFGNKETEDFFFDGDVPSKGCGWKQITSVVERKLDMIEAAEKLIDLREPPNNRLESLKGKLKGFYSIRINDQWRIIFRWEDGSAEDVEITDYH